ncbi:FHIPEP family type III secretion protein [Bordetella muralis]|uniref:FHIPEP family type III secretion protein n=1 Tax=Bordetella muralis TaxID=1649130 RepID=UPI0039EF8ADE
MSTSAKPGGMRSVKFKLGGDAALIALLVATLSLFILPLPTFLIDILIGMNLAISVLLLMVTMYIPSAVSLTSFPSLLLFTTIFRLSLNIASTKAILLHADAGHIISAFGNLVVGGNLIVGFVVFLIITVVQFIVIAKGSERVAEVGARFTLDAMPGKQMSIDADLRAGHLSADQARKRRGLLALESQLHGGMDGAMKFVKGDAIAGLIITLINLVAGIALGVTYHGMSAGESANLFAVLSIGDAMVSQVPSLLICVAAGVMITRVAEEDEQRRSLGDDIVVQLTRSWRALYAAALFLIGFALVPGFPWYVFLILAAVLVVSARHLQLRQRRGDADGEDPFKGFRRDGDSKRSEKPVIESQAAAFTAPLAVAVSQSLSQSLRIEMLNTSFDRERKTLQESLGLPFPGIRLWWRDTLDDLDYEVLLHDVPYSRGRLSQLEGEHQQTHEEEIARHAIRALHDQAHQFLGIQEVQWMLERVAKEYPGLVVEIQKVITPQRIAEVLRRLLEEHVPIRNMRAICESLVVWGPKEKDPLMLTEYVRGDLGRYLGYRATEGTGEVSAVLLEPSIEKLIREAIKPTPAGNYLALAPEYVLAIAERVHNLVGEKPQARVIMLTSMDIRRYVRRIVEQQVRWLAVYSFQELGDQVKVVPLGHVTL